MSVREFRDKLRPIVRRIYRLPLIGYWARIAVSFTKLSFLNSRVQQHEPLLPHTEGSVRGPAARVNGEMELREHLRALPNALSSVGAVGHELVALRRRVQGVVVI